MRSLKRALALATVALALTVAGCGATSHFVGGVVAHHALNHLAHTPRQRRLVNRVFCFYHGHRVLVDLRTHHVFAAGLNAVAAYRSCKAGFGRHG